MLLAQSASASSSITMIIAYVILFGAIIYFMTIRPQTVSYTHLSMVSVIIAAAAVLQEERQQQE